MELYNTLTRQHEPLTTDDGIYRMYLCGVTPYDTAHLGHAFTYVCFDVLDRYLEFRGYKTITVQNVTDIDDDILRRADKLGIEWNQLAANETMKYIADMQALNTRMPAYFPFATKVIDDILTIVSTLVDKGYAYEKNGSVYYDTQRDPQFGRLADMDYDAMLATANERGNFPDDPNKRDPLDFVLWQAAKPGEPTWESPWGEGRPGWHIECSAMSMRYLGPIIDIHAGGSDLIFPHHDCEIVQSERYSDQQPFVRYWFHVAMVRLDDEKMSKSLGNMIFVRDLLKQYAGNVIRLYLLTHHYRDAWSADEHIEELAEAKTSLAQWRAAVEPVEGAGSPLDPASYEADFVAALDHDLDTPRAVEVLNALASAIHAAQDERADVRDAQNVLRRLSGVLGVRVDVPV